MRRISALSFNTHYNLQSNIAFKLQKSFCNFIKNACDSNNKCRPIKVCINLVAQGSKTNISRTWNSICSIYNFDRSNIGSKIISQKPNTDEYICIKGDLTRYLISYSLYICGKQHNNVKEPIIYLCTE